MDGGRDLSLKGCLVVVRPLEDFRRGGRVDRVADEKDALRSFAQVFHGLPGTDAHACGQHQHGGRYRYLPHEGLTPGALLRRTDSLLQPSCETLHVHPAGVGPIEPLDLPIDRRSARRVLSPSLLFLTHRATSSFSLRVRRARLRWLFTAPSDIPMALEISAIDMSAW